MPAKDKATPSRQKTAPQRDVVVQRPRRDVEVTITLELGRTTCTLDQLLQFGEQSLFELDRTVGETVDILLNDRVCARGEVVTVGENFGVRVTEIVDGEATS